jgi:hypothetical protein
VLDEEERVEPVQGEGIEMERVAGHEGVGLCAEELGPGRSGPPRRRIDPGGVQDRPDGGRADLVAESGELAVDAAIPPSVARCRIRARTPAGMAGRPGRTGGLVRGG